MKTPLFIASLKMLSGLAALLVSASAKWIKEQAERKGIKKGALKMMKDYPKGKRPFDDPEVFVQNDHPQTVFFKDEIITNAYRPIVILLLFSLFSYTSTYYYAFLIVIILSFTVVEFMMEELKNKTWFILALIVIWFVTFAIIYFGEDAIQITTSIQGVMPATK